MSKHGKYVPKHRAAKHRAEGPALLPQFVPNVPKRALVGGLAVVAVAGGSTAAAAEFASSPQSVPTTSAKVTTAAQVTSLEHEKRADAVSRSLARPKVVSTPRPTPTPTPKLTPTPTPTPTPTQISLPYVSPGSAQAIAQSMFAARGWDGSQFSCLVSLWNRESHWNPYAGNASGAYGIPQALPGSKMGPGWQNNVTVQVSWGIGYIERRYGTPCGAWGHSQATGWY